ncbi:MAG TPA: CBS domain-containing protein [Bradyrhizobium sp.]|nr:CBS domain-containing protein [Stellaceae bacterium]HUN98624.1 CBS domain-containing protein [Bradyrhizobium sp.]
MQASDVMVRDVITVGSQTSVEAAVKLLAEYDVSALPVLDDDGALVGIISEADLIHRTEIGTEKHRAWWLESMTAAHTLAADFTKSHGKKVSEIMTPDVVVVSEDTSLGEIAALFERKRIKRVPVVRDGQLVGIVSRSNLIQALASRFSAGDELPETDRHIRLELLARMKAQDWTDFGDRNVIVRDGVVHLWGLVGTPDERTALIALAEGVPGVTRVADEMIAAYV